MLAYLLYCALLLLYSVFSYGLTAPNLVLSSNEWYWEFQQYSWATFFNNYQFTTIVYLLLILGLFAVYAHLIVYIRKVQKEQKQEYFLKKYFGFLYLGIIACLFISYNALSYDIFNYAFNAKMVLYYQANPHVQVATDFPQDPWLAFMHNVHTPAPYGYGWTALSLIPSWLGGEKLLPTLMLFRVFMGLSIVALYYALQHLALSLMNRKLNFFELALLFCNPLFLLEVVANYHNDLWMMAPAVASISFFIRAVTAAAKSKDARFFNRRLLLDLIWGWLLLFASIAIKLATAVLLPLAALISLLVIALVFSNKSFFVKVAQMCVVFGKPLIVPVSTFVLFLPLLTVRSQQFLPWYLLWSLVFLPFIQQKMVRNTFLLLSVTALLRYVPWMSHNFEYSDQVTTQQKAILWLLPMIYLVFEWPRSRQLYARTKK